MTEVSFDLHKIANAAPALLGATADATSDKSEAAGGSRSSRIETFLRLTRQAALTAVIAVVAWATISERGALTTALRGAFAKIDQINKFEAMGVSVIIDHPATEMTLDNLFDKKATTAEFRQEVRNATRLLGRPTFARLMQMDTPISSCVYPMGAPQTLQFILTDYQLVNLKLATMTPDPTTLAQLQQDIAKGAPSDNGTPVSCYTLTLSELGRDVKSLVVTRFATLFPEFPQAN